MPDLVSELIISLDGFARGQRSPAYYGYFGPDFADWIKTNTADKALGGELEVTKFGNSSGRPAHLVEGLSLLNRGRG
jgi:hypothetical protein